MYVKWERRPEEVVKEPLLSRYLHTVGFEILAFPCNQFGEQEIGTDEEIVQIACTRFNAEYLIFDKADLYQLIARRPGSLAISVPMLLCSWGYDDLLLQQIHNSSFTRQLLASARSCVRSGSCGSFSPCCMGWRWWLVRTSAREKMNRTGTQLSGGTPDVISTNSMI